MCGEFLLAASAPAFSFLYAAYALFTGDGIASGATQIAQKIRQLGNLDDTRFRSVLRMVTGYGKTVVLITGLVATILSYFTALFSARNIFGASQLYGFALVIVPVLYLLLCIMILHSVGTANLFTHKVLSPLRFLTGRAALGFSYGALLNAMAGAVNALLIAIFAASYGVLACRPPMQ